MRVFEYFLEKQSENGYKIGWIWYKLTEDFLPSPLEICWLSVVFEYSPQWAVYKIQELYEGVDQSTILAQIKSHKREWRISKLVGVFKSKNINIVSNIKNINANVSKKQEVQVSVRQGKTSPTKVISRF